MYTTVLYSNDHTFTLIQTFPGQKLHSNHSQEITKCIKKTTTYSTDDLYVGVGA